MMKFYRLTDLNLRNKRVLLRVDMNVPLNNGRVADASRIQASLPTIQYLLDQGASLILMSHLGRPEEGKPKPEDSLAPVAACLAGLIGKAVPIVSHWKDGISLSKGDIVLLENVRLNSGESANSATLGREYAQLADIFVNDAFGCAHRAEASTHAVAQFAPIAAAGWLMCSELEALAQALDKPARPLIAIVGGAKISTKLTILETLAEKIDQLIVGGGIANTFLLAQGYRIGSSLAEPSLVEAAQHIITKLHERGASLPLPIDVRVAKSISNTATGLIKTVTDLAEDDQILDIGPQTIALLTKKLANAGTIVWNGPVGVFEIDAFSQGTQALANAIGDSAAYSIAGGGDTLAAIAKFNVTDKISYISTGGGAFLEYLEGRALPAVSILEARAQIRDVSPNESVN